ncbi:MAG: hypothetical protein ACK48V_09190 [Crocinitomicaceae bacterium]|jgi:hypothetical protein
MKIYLDFDGTVVEHFYPLIGAYNPGAIEVLYLLQAKGYELILNTYRSEIKDNSLDEALHYINQLPLFKKITHTTTYKINPMQWDIRQAIESNQLFIDDIAPDMPLINAPKSGGKMVDWKMVYRDLAQARILD